MILHVNFNNYSIYIPDNDLFTKSAVFPNCVPSNLVAD